MAVRVLAAMLPHAEREEVAGDVTAEHAERARRDGRLRAGAWLWRQVLESVPALVRRSWWRASTGFEPSANEFRSGGPMYESWILDARFALRRLVRRPLYATLAVLTLALGVGGSAAIYGIVRELLLSPLPVAAESELAVWWMARNWSEAEHVYLRESGVPGFASTAAYGLQDVRLTGDGVTRVIPALRGSAELFDVLGVRPLMGAGFGRGDDVPGAEPKVVLSHGLWRELGSDPGLVGSVLEVDGVGRTVAGVMPRGFWFPDPETRLWLTHPFDAQARSGWYTIVGRLRPAQGPGDVDGALHAIGALLADRFEYSAAWDNSRDPELTPVREHIVGGVRPTLLATLAALGVILLIACANVAALMLGQMESRGSELSVRTALGAGRGRLTQQLLAEGVAVGVAAGVIGAAFAVAAFRMLLAALPLGSLGDRAELDWSVFAVSLLVAVVAALLIALVPVFAMLRADLRGSLTRARTGGIAGRGGRLESGLVVAEVALALVMAAGSAVLIRTVANLRAVETGIDPRGVAVVDVVLPSEVTQEERARMVGELAEAAVEIPGVVQSSAVQRLPLRGGGDNWGLNIEGRPEVTGVTTFFRVVHRDYFAVLRVPLLAGRLFEASDRADTERVVVINEALARQFFGGEDPVGRRIYDFGEFSRVIGVVADIREAGLTDEPAPARYLLYDQSAYAPAANALVLRVSDGLDPVSVLAAARQTVQRTVPGAGVQDATTMDRIVDRALGPAKQLMSLLSLLSALALLLGGIGVYGVVSHFVNRRRRDWGIRIALGLRPVEVLGRVVGRGALLVAAGVAIGIAGSLLLARVIGAFVFGVGAADPLAIAAAAATLFTVGIGGALAPAWRASRVDPARVLRDQ